MKRLLVFLLPAMITLTACSKQGIVAPPPADEAEWLQRERGYVAFSDFGCDYFVVNTVNGYSVMRSWSGTPPYEGDMIYGDLQSWGVSTFYVRSGRYLMRAEVRRSWLSYWEAMDEIQFRCGQWP